MNEHSAGAHGSLIVEDFLEIRNAFPRLGSDGFLVRPDGARSARETCLDTADGRFHRAGYTLAVREDGARTDIVLEPSAPRPGTPALRISAPLSAGHGGLDVDALPTALHDAVRAVTGRARLGAVQRREVRKQRFDVERRDRPAGAITLVETVAEQPDGRTSADRRVELDMATGEDLGALLAALRARLPQLDLESAAPQASARPAPRRRHRTIYGAALDVMRREVARCLDREPGSRLGVDPEELHDMRVATRRLRAALRVHRRYLPRGSRKIARELRWLGSVLGPVRDLDVMIGWLEERAKELPAADRPSLRGIEGRLRGRRVEARREMLAALDSERYARFVETTTAWLERDPDCAPRRGRRSAKRVAARLIERRTRKLIRARAALPPDATPADYHRLRILGKSARYALDFHAGHFGKPARRVLRRLVGLQDRLGEHHDIVVFLDRIPALLDDAPGETAGAARLVLEHLRHTQRARAETLLVGFPEAFAAFEDPAWRKLRRALRRARTRGKR
ncbi:MAG: CHAD domain-containing protein [Candidatus Eiseniibacteriota bacterium]